MDWLYDHKKPIIFLVALVGLIFEMIQPLLGGVVDSGLTVIFAGLLGTPLLIRSDEQRGDEVDRRVEQDRAAPDRPPSPPTSP